MFLKGRVCSECGSSLVELQFTEPHCFVCGFNHPDVTFPSKGLVSDILPRINFDRAKFGGRTTLLPPAVTFVAGYAYKTESINSGEWEEDKWETLASRSNDGHREAKTEAKAKRLLEGAPEQLFGSRKRVKSPKKRHRKNSRGRP